MRRHWTFLRKSAGKHCRLVRGALRGGRHWPKGAPQRRIEAKADKPKDYEPARILPEFAAERRIIAFWRHGRSSGPSRSGALARQFALFGQMAHGQLSAIRRTERGIHMNVTAVTLAVRMRLRQRALPYGSLWRRLGEYAG